MSTNKIAENKTAIIYTRAQENSEKERSVLKQKREMKRFARNNNIKIFNSFEDLGSGSNLNRPGLKQMKKFCDENKVDYILATDLARLGRFQDIDEWEYFKKKFFKDKKFIFSNQK